MSSGCVLGTISTTICGPEACSKAASLASSAARCAASSVPVWSMTRAVSAGTGSTSCAQAVPSGGPQPGGQQQPQRVHRRSALCQLRITSMRRGRCRGLVEVDSRRCADRRLVLHREVGLDRVAEDHRRQVGGEAARQHVEVVHRLDVAVARHGDAVLGAFELHAQVLEGGVGLQFGVALHRHHQPAQRAAQLALRGLELLEGLGVVDQLRRGLDAGGLGAGLDHLGQGLLLEVGLALDGADDVGDQVGAALVLVQHLRPRGLDLLVQALEVVVAAAGEQQRRQQGQQRSEASGDVHAASFANQGPNANSALADGYRALGVRGSGPLRTVRAMDMLTHALRGAASARRTTAARADVLLVVGGGGVLGSALLARALALRPLRPRAGAGGQGHWPRHCAASSRVPQAALAGPLHADSAVIVFERDAAQQRPRRGLHAA